MNTHETRIKKLVDLLNSQNKDWDAVFLFDKVNQIYFAGSIQNAVLVIKPNGDYGYFVKKSFERAKDESDLANIYRMNRYSDISDVLGSDIHNIFIDANSVTLSIMMRLQKYFTFNNVYPVESYTSRLRAVKTADEINIMRESGKRHAELLNNIVPNILCEGINEADFHAEVYKEMIKLGYHGISRFTIFQNETIGGQFGFGDNSIYPTSFDGPGGMKGLASYMPALSDRSRLLKKGDLVFADVGFGCEGYHTDKTQVYSFGAEPDVKLIEIHRECIRILDMTASLMKVGSIPSEIYNTVMSTISPEFKQNFMGVGNECVKFLGHSIGMYLDETPVIANGFNEPIELNMTFAVEPKKSIEGIGIVGVEESYVITENGAECITGGARDIITVM